MKLISKFLRTNWPLVLILLVAGLILSYKIDKPFWGHHDWGGAYWGNVARNYVRYGIFTSKLASIDSYGFLINPQQFSYTFHYSPLFPISMAIFFKFFGIFEWVTRLMSIMFSLMSIGVFFILVKKYFSLRTAVTASIFWVSTPMFIYFAKAPVHEPEVLFFALSAFYFYLEKKYLPVVLMIVLAELTSWPGYFLVPAITLHWYFFNRKPYTISKITILWLTSILIFLSLLIHDLLVTGSPWGGGLAEIFFFRVHNVTLVPYITLLVRWVMTYFTPVLLILGAYTLVMGKKVLRRDILFLFFAFAIIYPIVFRDASMRHDYLLIYFWPFITLSAAIAIELLLDRREKFKIAAIFLIVILMLAMRFKFILALENSDIYRESVRFGKYINANSKQSEKVLAVAADPNVGFDGNFIGFYADRQIVIEKQAPKDTSSFDKIFYFFPGSKITAGANANTSGIK